MFYDWNVLFRIIFHFFQFFSRVVLNFSKLFFMWEGSFSIYTFCFLILSFFALVLWLLYLVIPLNVIDLLAKIIKLLFFKRSHLSALRMNLRLIPRIEISVLVLFWHFYHWHRHRHLRLSWVSYVLLKVTCDFGYRLFDQSYNCIQFLIIFGGLGQWFQRETLPRTHWALRPCWPILQIWIFLVTLRT